MIPPKYIAGLWRLHLLLNLGLRMRWPSAHSILWNTAQIYIPSTDNLSTNESRVDKPMAGLITTPNYNSIL